MNKRSAEQVVEVAPAVPLKAASRQTYTYAVPPGVARGDDELRHRAVAITFGRQHVTGVITDVHQRRPGYTLRALDDVFPYQLTDEQMAFARWLAMTMQGGLGFTLRLFQPPRGPLPALSWPVVASSPPSSLVPAARTLVRHLKTRNAIYLEPRREKQWTTMAHVVQAYQKNGGQIVVIVPEKWMIEPLVEKLRPLNAVPVEADQSVTLLRRTWHQLARGDTTAVVGTQKALFLPYRGLRLIIMMEEPYSSHTLWDQYPRLANRYGIAQVAQLHGARRLFVATQGSLWLQYMIDEKKLAVVCGRARQWRFTVITPTVIDRLKRWPVPTELVEQIRRWVRRGERVAVLYTRRRGLTNTIARLFPDAIHNQQLIVTTTALFTQTSTGQWDRVVWLFPELSLRYPDFRSVERSYILLSRLQTLTTPKHAVMLVTRQPQLVHETLLQPASQWYEQQLFERRRLNYPPFTDMIRLTIARASQAQAMKAATQLRRELMSRLTVPGQVMLRGPFVGFHTKRKGNMEAHLLLVGQLSDLTPLYEGLAVDAVDLDPPQIL